MSFIVSFINSLPSAVTQGMIWGIMAMGVYITYKILDIADLTVDATLCTGGAVCAIMTMNGVNIWVSIICAITIGISSSKQASSILNNGARTDSFL